MKKMLLTALLGLGLVLVSGSRASAWSRFNWGAGFNVGWEGGGNSVLFGLFKGENIPDMGGMNMGAPMMPATGAGSMPNAPRNCASTMPQSTTQPVGYVQPGQAQPAPAPETPGDYAAPSYWYDR